MDEGELLYLFFIFFTTCLYLKIKLKLLFIPITCIFFSSCSSSFRQLYIIISLTVLKTRMLERNFHTLIGNISLSSPTEVKSHAKFRFKSRVRGVTKRILIQNYFSFPRYSFSINLQTRGYIPKVRLIERYKLQTKLKTFSIERSTMSAKEIDRETNIKGGPFTNLSLACKGKQFGQGHDKSRRRSWMLCS